MLSTDKQRSILCSGGAYCPECHSADLEGGLIRFDSGALIQPVTFHNCGLAWRNRYRLEGVEAANRH